MDFCFFISGSFSLVWFYLLIGNIKITSCRITPTFWQHVIWAQPHILILSPNAFNTTPSPVINPNTLLQKSPIILHGMCAPMMQDPINTFSTTGVFLEIIDWNVMIHLTTGCLSYLYMSLVFFSAWLIYVLLWLPFSVTTPFIDYISECSLFICILAIFLFFFLFFIHSLSWDKLLEKKNLLDREEGTAWCMIP